jgi:transcriptional regulator of arginine metabolism
MALKKQERQSRILDIIASEQIDSQDDLLRELEEMGIAVTQATISRDIKELRIVRRADVNGRSRYQVMTDAPAVDQAKLAEGFGQLANMTTRVEFMVIVKTTAGNGNRLAAGIDAAGLPEVVGTLAGHDTIFVITPSAEVAELLNNRFDSWIQV